MMMETMLTLKDKSTARDAWSGFLKWNIHSKLTHLFQRLEERR